MSSRALIVLAAFAAASVSVASHRARAQTLDPPAVQLAMTPAQVAAFLDAVERGLPYVPFEVVVKFKDGVSRGDQQKALMALRSRPDVDDIRWQVFDGWSYAVGDVVLGTNPVSNEPGSVAAIERTLRELLVTFGMSVIIQNGLLEVFTADSRKLDAGVIEIASVTPVHIAAYIQTINALFGFQGRGI